MLAIAAFVYLAVAGVFFSVGLQVAKAERGDTFLAALTALVWPVSALAVIVHARHWRESHALYFQERGL